MAKSPVIERLLEKRIVAKQDLAQALKGVPKDKPWFATAALIMNNLVSEDIIRETITEITNFPSIALSQIRIPGYVAKLIKREDAIRYLAIPIALKIEQGREVLYVAFFDPSDYQVVDTIAQITRREVKPIVATLTDLLNTIDKFLRPVKPSDTEERSGERLKAIIGTPPQASTEPQTPTPTPTPSQPQQPIQAQAPEEEEINIEFDILEDEPSVSEPSQAPAQQADTATDPLASQTLPEPELLNRREVTATEIEQVISNRHVSDTELKAVVDFDNQETPIPEVEVPVEQQLTAQEPTNSSSVEELLIPSATELLDLPTKPRRDTDSGLEPQSPSETTGFSVGYGLPDETGEVELPDEATIREDEDDLSLDLDALYSKLNVPQEADIAQSEEIRSIDDLFDEENAPIPHHITVEEDTGRRGTDALKELEELAEQQPISAEDTGGKDDVKFVYDFVAGQLPKFKDPDTAKLARLLSAVLRLLIEKKQISELDLLKEFFKD